MVVSGYANPVRNKHLKESLQALIQKQASLISGLLQPVISGAKAQQQVEAHSRPQSAKFVRSDSLLQDGNSRDHQTLPSTRGVGHFAGFQQHLLSHSNKLKVVEVLTVPSQQSDISIHRSSFWPVDGSIGVYQGRQGSQVDGTGAGYSNPPVPRRLVSESPVPGNVPTRYPDLLGPMSRSRMFSQSLKVRTGSTTVFHLCRLSFRPLSRSGQTHSGEVDSSVTENQPSFGTRDLLSQAVHVPNRSVTATEKQVVLGRLHMRPIQWHSNKHWHFPEALEKIIPLPKSLHVHLRWWMDPNKVLKGQPLHPLRHALQLFTDASNEGWGAHLGDCTARGLWSEPEGDLHINLLELKAVLLALKQFEHLCWHQTILVCTDNTTLVTYINKEGGMKSGSLCALLWRLLLWCNQRQIVLWARHILGHLNSIADKLSRHKQVIQTEWSLLQEVFDLLCRRWHKPDVDLFATRFSHKLPRFVSPVPDKLAWKAGALSLQWENLDAYAFPPVAILGQVVTKLLDQGCHRIILIAQGWPNMPWFWDLVNMSVQIPLALPIVENLLTQPSQSPHRDLHNLNLHAWLLEPQSFSKQVSLRKWQQELRLLRDIQPELSMNQSGPFLSDGARRIRWTSGLLL